MKKAFLLILAGVLISAYGLASATAYATGSNNDYKVWVCKYVGKPGDFETLKDGKQPIQVSANAADDYVGADFADGQNHSYVIALVTPENTDNHNDYIGEATCPVSQGGGSTTTTTNLVTTTTKPCNSTTTTEAPTTSTTAPCGDCDTTTTTQPPLDTTTMATSTTRPPLDTTTMATSTTVAPPPTGSTVPPIGATTTTTLVPPAPLPFTGSSPWPLVFAGMSLIGTGAFMISRKRRVIS